MRLAVGCGLRLGVVCAVWSGAACNRVRLAGSGPGRGRVRLTHARLAIGLRLCLAAFGHGSRVWAQLTVDRSSHLGLGAACVRVRPTFGRGSPSCGRGSPSCGRARLTHMRARLTHMRALLTIPRVSPPPSPGAYHRHRPRLAIAHGSQAASVRLAGGECAARCR